MLAAEHALKFKPRQPPVQITQIPDELVDGTLIAFFQREIQQLAGIGQGRRQVIEQANHFFELRALLAQALRAFGILPDGGILELATYLDEPLIPRFIVKGTPLTPGCVH